MKTLTNAQLYQLLPALSTIIAKDIPMKIAIDLRKTLTSIKTILADLDEIRQGKTIAHTSQDDKGKDIIDEAAFAVDMEIMLKETSEIDIHQVQTSQFPDDFTITTADLDILLETSILTE